MTNKTIFVESMIMLQSMYNHNVKNEVLEAYWQCLKNLSDYDFKTAVQYIISSFTPTAACPFPLIPHIMAGCGKDDDTMAINTINRIKQAVIDYGYYRSVDFRDGALHATINRFGGWMAVSNWTDKDWQYNERNFINAYKAAKRDGMSDPPVVGFIEQTNKSGGFKYDPPMITQKNNISMIKNIGKIEYDKRP